MLKRQQLGRFLQMITGHCGLNYFANLSHDPDADDEPPPPLCPLCEEDDQTPAHVLGACPAFFRLRWEIFGHVLLDPPFDDLKISQILRFMSGTKLKPLQWHVNNDINNNINPHNVTPPGPAPPAATSDVVIAHPPTAAASASAAPSQGPQ